MANAHQSRTLLLALVGVLAIALIGWIGFLAASPNRPDVETVSNAVYNNAANEDNTNTAEPDADTDVTASLSDHAGQTYIRGVIDAIEDGQLTLEMAFPEEDAPSRELTVLITEETTVASIETAVMRGPGTTDPVPVESSVDELATGSIVVVYTVSEFDDETTELTAVAIDLLK